MLRFSLFLIILICFSCKKDPVTSDPTPYPLQQPEFFSEMNIPADNPLTMEGVRLGKFLFFDPILSSDSTISCASCHNPELAFSDDKKLSPGVDEKVGIRNSMALVNVGYFNNGFFWDGRAATLEEQSLHPIQDPNEMNESLENVVLKMRRHSLYSNMFKNAFSLKNEDEITIDLVAKALAQFERTLVSADSRYDQAVSFENPTVEYTQLELDGYLLFFRDIQTHHPGCHHCHAPPLFGGDTYFNNGLDEALNLEDFPDLGLGGVNGNKFDNGKFKTPGLRNIEFSAPYMHDGRFETLEEVLEHYSSGGHYSDNLDPNITGFTMTEYEKSALLSFLKTLSDPGFLNNPDFQSPF